MVLDVVVSNPFGKGDVYGIVSLQQDRHPKSKLGSRNIPGVKQKVGRPERAIGALRQNKLPEAILERDSKCRIPDIFLDKHLQANTNEVASVEVSQLTTLIVKKTGADKAGATSAERLAPSMKTGYFNHIFLKSVCNIVGRQLLPYLYLSRFAFGLDHSSPFLLQVKLLKVSSCNFVCRAE